MNAGMMTGDQGQTNESAGSSSPVIAIPGTTITRQVFWLAGPVFIEQSLLYLVGLSDTLLAGRYLQAEHLAGVTVASYLLWFLGALLTIGSIGGTALVARSIGAGRTDEAVRFCGQAFALGLGLGFVAFFLVQVLSPLIVAAMSLSGLAAQSAVRFLRIVGAVMPLLACTTVGNACLRGAGDTRTGMRVMILMNIVNITMTWTLGVGWGPIPGLGLSGIALGTACGEGIGGPLILALLIRGRSGLRLTWRNLWPAWDCILRLLRVSLPATGERLTNVVCQQKVR